MRKDYAIIKTPGISNIASLLWSLRMRMIDLLIRKGLLGNIIVALPYDIKVYVNNRDTLDINIPDMFERLEYMLHRDFYPKKDEVVLTWELMLAYILSGLQSSSVMVDW